MKISNASLDCWLWAGILRPDYSDYQHHHWDLSPSPNIDHTINYSNYIWTLDSNGRDSSGRWAVNHGSLPSKYSVSVNSSGKVVLKQTVPYGTNVFQSTGTSSAVVHPVPELGWPSLTWDPNLTTPTTINFSNGNPPFEHIFFRFVLNRGFIEDIEEFFGSGGEDYTTKTQYYQKPAGVGATAWWQWAISLA